MSVGEGTAGQLEEAQSAVDARSWTRAYELLMALRAQQPLGPEDLERLAKAAYWTGDADGSIWTREEAYAAYSDRGDDERAALCALTLRREHMSKLRDSVADAWLSRAEHLLKERPDSTANGYLAIAHADDGARPRPLREGVRTDRPRRADRGGSGRPPTSHLGHDAARHVPDR